MKLYADKLPAGCDDCPFMGRSLEDGMIRLNCVLNNIFNEYDFLCWKDNLDSSGLKDHRSNTCPLNSIGEKE